MKKDELTNWKDGVKVHMAQLDAIVEDRKLLKSHLEEHLSSVFDWDDIEYNRDFSVVSLKWESNHQPIVRSENLKKLGMDFLIKPDYDDCANRIVVIEVYPFGVEDKMIGS